MNFRLRVPANKLPKYLKKYDYPAEDQLTKFHNISAKQGYLTAGQLHEICLWKSKRRANLAKANSAELVKEITEFAFSAKCEASKIGALTLLEGVHFPTASVILHFCVDQTYPILDIRALWSLSIEKPAQYTVPFWESYVHICRSLAQQHGMSVRDFDKALWQYSKENQNNIP